MLTPEPSPAASPAERADAARRLRTALGQVLRDLHRLAEAVRKARAALPPPQDPVSLHRLLESRERALRHAERAGAGLGPADGGGEGGASRALADVHELVEEVRAGLASPRILDDLGEMIAETPAGPAGRALRALDTRTRRIGAEADRLFALAVAAQQDLLAGADPMPQSPSPPVATGPRPGSRHPQKAGAPSASGGTSGGSGGTFDGAGLAAAVRDLGEIVATVADRSAPAAPARSAAGRYAAVADQMAASLDAFGLPRDGVQLPPTEGADAVRARLIDGLRRNFAWRDADGTRTYYRTTPQPIVREADADARLLRGAALVNANLLRAEADGVLAIMDRLPDMLRFVSTQPFQSGAERGRVRLLLDQLVATASDPLGLNARRGQYQFGRLSVVLLDILLRGEVIDRVATSKVLAQAIDDPVAPWRNLSGDAANDADSLRVSTSGVRDEEVDAELVELGRLMVDIHARLSGASPGGTRGIAAGRLEDLLTAADGAAAMLEADLARFGTSPAEQGVQFLGDTSADISLAQFIAWVRAMCEPFTGAGNQAAALLPDELGVLVSELAAVNVCAGSFMAVQGMPTRFVGVRRQFDELKRFLREAEQQATALATPRGTNGARAGATIQE